MRTGTFSLHRSLLDHSLWGGEAFTRGQAWVDLIGHAAWKDGFIRVRGQRIDLERGELAWSERELAKRWRWSRGKVDRFLQELKDDGRIIRYQQAVPPPSPPPAVSKSDSENCGKNMQNPAPQTGPATEPRTGPATEPRTGPAKNYITSVIRILNYDDYQPNGTTDDTTDRATDETTNQTTDRANHGPVTGQRRAQRKKVKKVNKREEATLDDFDALCGEDRFALLRRPEIRGKVEFWLNCRTQRNKPLTVNAVTRDMLNMVRVLKAGGTAELIGEWMATAEYNHWQGWFFPESFEKWKGSGAKSVGRTTYKPLEERDDNE